MSKRTTGKNTARDPSRRWIQFVIVLVALVVAIYLVTGSESVSVTSPQFDMLSYLDSRVAAQEDVKDVRCWSSFCKLQMFLIGAPIDDEAVGVRIEKHMELIESIWEDVGSAKPDQRVIGPDDVSTVLVRRFPYQYDALTGAMFELEGVAEPIYVGSEAIKDYSDTIEPWRLLQTWASQHTNASGGLTLSPPLDKEALHFLSNFLRIYDLTILKHARAIAEEKKLAAVDASSMSEAFNLESKLK